MYIKVQLIYNFVYLLLSPTAEIFVSRDVSQNVGKDHGNKPACFKITTESNNVLFICSCNVKDFITLELNQTNDYTVFFLNVFSHHVYCNEKRMRSAFCFEFLYKISWFCINIAFIVFLCGHLRDVIHIRRALLAMALPLKWNDIKKLLF